VLILNEGQIVAKGTPEEINREMKGEVLLEVLLKGGGKPDGVKEVAGIRELLQISSPGDDLHKVQVSLLPDSGAEEAVFDWAVERGYKILAMVPKRLSLEELFIKLTREGGEKL
jgi:ABC-type multidrug transport system ATPase subunit